MICCIEGCGKSGKMRRGLCTAHYTRLVRHGDPLKGGTAFGAPMAWFLAHRDFDGPRCLIWPFNKNNAGYGRISIGGKNVLVTRAMCEHRHGPAPTDKHEAAHSCGNGRHGCIHPGHLDWKTRVENQADRLKHGTDSRGEKNYGHKLNASAVELIRSTPALPTAKLAEVFGVSRNTIKAARSGKTWAWLTPIQQQEITT